MTASYRLLTTNNNNSFQKVPNMVTLQFIICHQQIFLESPSKKYSNGQEVLFDRRKLWKETGWEGSLTYYL